MKKRLADSASLAAVEFGLSVLKAVSSVEAAVSVVCSPHPVVVLVVCFYLPNVDPDSVVADIVLVVLGPEDCVVYLTVAVAGGDYYWMG